MKMSTAFSEYRAHQWAEEAKAEVKPAPAASPPLPREYSNPLPLPTDTDEALTRVRLAVFELRQQVHDLEREAAESAHFRARWEAWRFQERTPLATLRRALPAAWLALSLYFAFEVLRRLFAL